MIVLGKNEYTLEKPKLKKWLSLENLRLKLKDSVEKGNSDDFINQYYSLISFALGITREELENLPWIDVAVAYIEIVNLQVPDVEFPMLLAKNKGDDDWNYEGREWYIWLHYLAKNYGWSIEYISDLDVNDAIALLQEILSSEFYAKEWQWGMSELAYTFDKNTNSGKYNPLPKPEWMKTKTIKQELPKVKIRRDFLPSGIVRSWSDAEHGEST